MKVKLLMFILPFLFVPSVHAQTSPFADLNNPEEPMVESSGDVTIEDFVEMKDLYDEITDQLKNAYGTQRSDLLVAQRARAKDILTAKLVATANYVSKYETTDTDLLAAKEDYEASISELQNEINDSESLEDLRLINTKVNVAVNNVLVSYEDLIAEKNQDRGEELTAEIQKLSPLISSHMSKAFEQVGKSEDLQDEFDAAMVILETETDIFKALNSSITGLVGIIDQLRVLHSQSPWFLSEETVSSLEEILDGSRE